MLIKLLLLLIIIDLYFTQMIVYKKCFFAGLHHRKPDAAKLGIRD